jgi:acylphosphatase
MKTVHLEITGKVQGVFFRATAKDVAKIHNISGWIKNTDDNKVEAIVTGNSEDVDAFIAWSKKGPEKAKVINVQVSTTQLQHFDSFKVIR